VKIASSCQSKLYRRFFEEKWSILSSRSEVASVIQGVPFILSPTMEALSHRKSKDIGTSRDTFRVQGHALTFPSQRGFPFHE